MIKRILTFWTVVLVLLLFFVIFFFDTFQHLGFLAKFLKWLVIILFVARTICLILLIIKDKKEQRDEEKDKLAELIIERQIEKLNGGRKK